MPKFQKMNFLFFKQNNKICPIFWFVNKFCVEFIKLALNLSKILTSAGAASKSWQNPQISPDRKKLQFWPIKTTEILNFTNSEISGFFDFRYAYFSSYFRICEILISVLLKKLHMNFTNFGYLRTQSNFKTSLPCTTSLVVAGSKAYWTTSALWSVQCFWSVAGGLASLCRLARHDMTPTSQHTIKSGDLTPFLHIW